MGIHAKKDLEKRLRPYQKQLDRIKERTLKIGFICKGSLIERWLPCGNPNCPCHKDPKKQHGPYYQLSWKESGKTVSHFLSPESVSFYRKWIENRRRLMGIIDEMLALSRKAGDCIRTREKRDSSASQKGKKTRKKAP